MNNSNEQKQPMLGVDFNLSNIFRLGIVRTLWKSHKLDKINELRGFVRKPNKNSG